MSKITAEIASSTTITTTPTDDSRRSELQGLPDHLRLLRNDLRLIRCNEVSLDDRSAAQIAASSPPRYKYQSCHWRDQALLSTRCAAGRRLKAAKPHSIGFPRTEQKNRKSTCKTEPRQQAHQASIHYGHVVNQDLIPSEQTPFHCSPALCHSHYYRSTHNEPVLNLPSCAPV